MLSVFRKEIKYVLYSQEFAALRDTLAALMYKDPHGGNFGYRVRSLYFDTPENRDYYSAVVGLQSKCKLRLRIYDGNDSLVKLERKCKEGSDSLKTSLTLTREEAERMQAGDYGFLARRPEDTARQIYLQLLQGVYRPSSLMEYEREAYTFPAGDVRVTFDSNVCATVSAWDLFDPAPPFAPVIPAGTGVLEVKYSSQLPPFIRAALETGRQSSANSKYVQSKEFYTV